jgi:hypothetical protein
MAICKHCEQADKDIMSFIRHGERVRIGAINEVLEIIQSHQLTCENMIPSMESLGGKGLVTGKIMMLAKIKQDIQKLKES